MGIIKTSQQRERGLLLPMPQGWGAQLLPNFSWLGAAVGGSGCQPGTAAQDKKCLVLACALWKRGIQREGATGCSCKDENIVFRESSSPTIPPV